MNLWRLRGEQLCLRLKIFSAFIVIGVFKTVQNIKKRVYFSMSKLFMVENGFFFLRYKSMKIEAKGIG